MDESHFSSHGTRLLRSGLEKSMTSALLRKHARLAHSTRSDLKVAYGYEDIVPLLRKFWA